MSAWVTWTGASVLAGGEQALDEVGRLAEMGVARLAIPPLAYDPAAVGALFTSDADQLVSSGEWRRGRDALVKGTLASSQRTGGNRTITLETIRFPSKGVAIADGRYEIIGGAGGDRRMWSTFVMTREAETWRIDAIRNMLPAPPAQ